MIASHIARPTRRADLHVAGAGPQVTRAHGGRVTPIQSSAACKQRDFFSAACKQRDFFVRACAEHRVEVRVPSSLDFGETPSARGSAIRIIGICPRIACKGAPASVMPLLARVRGTTRGSMSELDGAARMCRAHVDTRLAGCARCSKTSSEVDMQELGAHARDMCITDPVRVRYIQAGNVATGDRR
jgi:hypothetical protein